MRQSARGLVATRALPSVFVLVVPHLFFYCANARLAIIFGSSCNFYIFHIRYFFFLVCYFLFLSSPAYPSPSPTFRYDLLLEDCLAAHYLGQVLLLGILMPVSTTLLNIMLYRPHLSQTSILTSSQIH